MPIIEYLKNFFLIGIFCIVLTFLGCSEKKAPEMQVPPPLVDVITLIKADIPVKNSYVAITEGSEAVEVRAQVSGILKSRDYTEGGYVKAGDKLFQIEPNTYNAAFMQAKGNLAQADAKLTQAKENFTRTSQLFAKNAVSRMDYDNAKGDYDGAKAQAEAAKAAVTDARIRLDYTSVQAPVSGYTGKANMSIGNLISATSSNGNLLTVVNKVDPIYVNFFIPDPEFATMKELESKGLLVLTEPYAEMTYFGNMKFPNKGKINFMDKQVNRTTGDINVRAEFRNDNFTVMPGQFVTVTIYGSYLKNAILVPQEALIQTAQGSMVIIVDKDNIARYRPVELGPSIGSGFLLFNGIESGERIIIQGTNKARPNAPIRINEQKTDKTVQGK